MAAARELPKYAAQRFSDWVRKYFSGKKQDSEKAVQFIDDQIKSYEEKLTAAENTLKEFKIKNMGLLPRDGGGSNPGQHVQGPQLLRTSLAGSAIVG